ncbi:MAG TPA: flotillin domain-containing protein, partial [Burkholderiaceae bacterium]|nr:flotillin domain-containing protein [Burkholderiaceae bacterium]
MTWLGWLLLLLVAAAIVVVVAARFYERGTREVSLVKTGVGGRRIVMDGGTIAIPYFHEVSRVNMQTLRLEVRRAADASLITKDRLRVDVGAEFYVSVIPTEEGVARAAQTLGNRTFDPDKLRQLIEGKLVDALRSVAARYTMDELHENRGAFVSEVRDGLAESLARNGLELDTVSLTALDQTPFKALDENNAFNAVGMRKLAEVIAKSKKERAEIDADADVSVRRAAMEATRRKLQIELEEQQAEIAQVQQIETLKAAQLAEVVKRKADAELESARARISMEQQVRAADIARERAIREAEIAKERELREAEIARERDVELANQERMIALAAKSQQESRARAAADAARAEAIRATEQLATVKQVAEAERRREIALLAARQETDIAGNRMRTMAAAERDAAVDRARARVEEAKGDADAMQMRAAAKKQDLLAEAEGRRAIIDSENAMDHAIVSMKLDLARLDALPRVVAEMVKPAEKIDSIRIHQISGLGSSAYGGGGGQKPAVNQAIDSIMEMAVQLPALKKLGDELGMSLD